MKILKHEIKVALLGNVSTGKTMTMNALFGNKYGEVSMKRTTAAVNYFKISTSPAETISIPPCGNSATISPSNTDGAADDSNGATTTESWHPETDEPRSPESTLKEISEDNRRLRDDTGSTLVQEKWFDIELDEPLCDMRNDTRLVIVDIPGINEAGACSKYKDYVNQKWHTFDCVVLVMDGKQGVNTEDQVLLLNLVKSNKERIKNVSVIILFNKVDDPEDQEQAELIREAFQEIEALFNNKKKEIHASGKHTANTASSPPPVFSFGAPSAPSTGSTPSPFWPGTQTQNKFVFGTAPSAPSTPSPFWSGTQTQNKFVFGTAPSQVGTSTNMTFTFGSVTPPASLPTTQPPIDRTPSHLQNNRVEVVTPNEKEDVSTEEAKDESVGPRSDDGLAKADLAELHEKSPFKNLPPSVAFIPVSSLHGFANRCASRMTLESFCKFFDKELIEKVGKEQIGRRQWKQLSGEERTKAVYDMLSDPDECRDVLHDSRFDKFMTKLKQFVGGDEVQTRLIEEQIKVSLKTVLDNTNPFQVSFKAETGKNIAEHIQEAYTKMQSLKKHAIDSNINIPADEFTAAFWKAYNSIEKCCFHNFKTFGPGNCQVLSEPLDELEAFHAVAKEIGWSKVAGLIVGRMQKVVQQMIGLFLKKASMLAGGYSSWSIKLAEKENDPWKRLSPLDWSNIWSSILLLSYDRQFCLAFGTEKMLMERELFDAQTSWHAIAMKRCCPACRSDLPMQDQQTACGEIVVFFVKCSSCNLVFTKEKYNVQVTPTCLSCRCRQARPMGLTCSSCKDVFVCSTTRPKDWALLKYDGLCVKTEAKYPTIYKFVSSVRVVKSVKNKHHCGHAAYRFCEFMDR